LQCCKVLGRKIGLEKRTTAVHELPGPGKPKPDMQKDLHCSVANTWKKNSTTAQHYCLVSVSKTGHALEQLHFTLPCPGKHKPDMQKKNFIALLHGPG
jgi:hypothetical protein